MAHSRYTQKFSTKIIFITLLVSIVSSVIISAVSIGYSRYHFRVDSQNHIKTLVKIVADSLDGDVLDAIGPEDMGSAAYWNIFNFMDRFRAAPDVKYIYTMRKVGDEVQFIVDVDDSDVEAVGDVFPTYEEIEQAFTGLVTVDKKVSVDIWGKYYSAFAPVRNREGKIVAIVGIDCSLENIERRTRNMTSSLFSIQMIGLLIVAALSIVAARIMAHYVDEASRDGLTGVYNRRYAARFIDETMERKGSFGFLLLDIDYFKLVNDTYGHRVGDQILQALAKILTKSCRSSDISFRLGGDEFAVFFAHELTQEQLGDIADRIQKEFSQVVERLCPSVAQAGLSFGGLVGTHAGAFGDLYHRADKLLYEVKNTGKGSCIVEKIS